MLQVSDAYKELVKSNIRLKCEPTIKVSGTDNNGNKIELVWNAKDIKDLTFKRSADPIGRELPFMELTWTEIYTGKLNAQNYPEKYNNIASYMKVELSFTQDLGFYNIWQSLLNNGTTWKSLFSQNTTWKQLKKSVPQEIIKMPTMFLSAKPTIKGQTITWVAKDLLFFLDNSMSRVMTSGVPFPYFIANIIAANDYNYNEDLKNAIQTSQENIWSKPLEHIEFDAQYVLMEDLYKNLVLNFANLKTWHIRFRVDGSFDLYPYYSLLNLENTISSNIMYAFPEINFGKSISNYSFENNFAELDEKSNYEVSFSSYEDFEGIRYYHYEFPEPSEALSKNNPDRYVYSAVYDAVTTDGEKIVATPYVNFSRKNTLKNEKVGEDFIEKNKLNPHSQYSQSAKDRLNYLNDYFNKDRCDLQFSCLPILQYEPLDVVYVETNLFKENGEKIQKQIVINYVEIKYNGAIRETIKGHEVNIFAG